jgi:8-oxo-dGTP diphosphatase
VGVVSLRKEVSYGSKRCITIMFLFGMLIIALLMLRRITELPKDKRIAGVHSVPLLDDGSIIMVWDRNEQVLTTVGGRIEDGEDIDQALNRETVEEAGVILKPKRIPFAS